MMEKSSKIYELDGRVPLLQAIPFGLQHVMAMFVANITPIIILANAAGIDSAVSATLIQNCMIIAGIGTLIQLYPIWRIGSRLPIVMGISFTFLSAALAIATTQGMGVLMGAVIVGGIIEGLLGLFPNYWTKLIPHIVAATVVTAIGFSLLPIGANSFAGGQGSADFGSVNNWIVGSFTLLVCLGFQIFSKGFFRSLSVLIGMIAGYVLAACMGMVNFSGLNDIGIMSLPNFMPFKPEF
jgi:NCS2 family nucleobase:cation symporter-2